MNAALGIGGEYFRERKSKVVSGGRLPNAF